MINDIDHALLASYLAGECSDAEAEEVRAWLVASPDNAGAFQEFETLWRTAPRAAVAWNVDAAWNKVHGAFRAGPRLTLTSSEPSEPAPVQPPVRRFLPARSRPWVAAAAAAALLIGTSTVMLSRFGPQPAAQIEPLPMREVATVKGQRTSVRLSDGTQVSLGVDSKLHFAPVFGVTARDVYLEGEAFFDVTHDPDKPFIVHAAGSITRVLGTKFGLRAYAGEPEVRLAVAEGKVRLRLEHADSNQGLLLTRNQLGTLASDGQMSLRQNVDVRPYMNWIDGRIAFDDTPLREVVKELEHWYDADLVLADPGLDSLRFSMVFDQESLDVVVRVIARTLNLEYRRTGSAVVFSRHPGVDS